ncbi:MAG: exo-alpha-sialidase, partial [Proteobacteria bacterium]|nr:exo-alpha-sialidase [Pseudomonadota bacterium]
MATRTLVLLGTKKGAFVMESDGARRDWTLRGPFCEAWPINHVAGDPQTGAIHAGGGNEWFGPAVWTTRDFGATWGHSSNGLTYAEGEAPITSVWSLAARDGRLYAGVQP